VYADVSVTSSDGTPPTDPPQVALARLMDGYLTTQLLHVVARLGVADVLKAAPRTADDVAAAVGADPALLRRVLRGLVVDGVLDEDADGRFSLTALGAWLRRDVDGSLHGQVVMRGDLYYHAGAALLAAVTDGGVPFDRTYRRPFFEHLERHPEIGRDFQTAMSGRAEREAVGVVAVYDFTGVRRVVDVGGGRGALLEAVLNRVPGASGTLVDRPAVVAQARSRLAAAGLADRCEFVTGDFFESVPGGGEVYLLSRILHDWDDAAATRIVANCRAALTPSSRLLIVDAVMPRRAADLPAAVRMDLHMMMLLGARERTEDEFRTLLSAAGVALSRVIPTSSPDGLSVIEAVPVPGR
jgi:trans-aconitate methyltransferase